MNSITAANILNWALLALVLTSVITFVCALHEQYVNRKRRKRQPDTIPTLARPSASNRTPARSAPKKLIVRGYDSPELLREDLWLLRLEHGRNNIALLNMRVPPFETIVESGESHEQRVTAMLAQYAGARCDN